MNEIPFDPPVPNMANMSLRDWFAGLAMQALIGTAWGQDDDISWEHIARAAYKQAGAMIEKRNEEQKA